MRDLKIISINASKIQTSKPLHFPSPFSLPFLPPPLPLQSLRFSSLLTTDSSSWDQRWASALKSDSSGRKCSSWIVLRWLGSQVLLGPEHESLNAQNLVFELSRYISLWEGTICPSLSYSRTNPSQTPLQDGSHGAALQSDPQNVYAFELLPGCLEVGGPEYNILLVPEKSQSLFLEASISRQPHSCSQTKDLVEDDGEIQGRYEKLYERLGSGGRWRRHFWFCPREEESKENWLVGGLPALVEHLLGTFGVMLVLQPKQPLRAVDDLTYNILYNHFWSYSGWRFTTWR